MGFQSYLADVYVLMRRCPQPIIALIQGPACGGGFSFVMAADIRIAGDTAQMNAASRRARWPADWFPKWYRTTNWPTLPGHSSPTCCAPRRWVCTSPMGLHLTKDGLNIAIDAGSLEAAIAIENRNQHLCARTEDAAEGMRAFVEKREPV